MINKCRVCHHHFFNQPLLSYAKMPKKAQYLPDAKSLKKDKGVRLEVHQCSGCGLVQINNQPVSYYKQVIRAAGISPEMKTFRINQFTDFIKKYGLRNKKIIEIGCGRGEYLSLMQKCGAETYGIEDSQESVGHCQKIGLKVSKGYLEKVDNKLNDGPFAAFFILNFLEHFPKPNTALKGIGNNLTKDGIGMVEVPNFDMMLRKKIFSEFMTDHLFYFTKETLTSTLTMNGFEILECHEIFYDYVLSAIVKKRQKLDLSSFEKHQTKITKDIKSFLKRFKKKKVGIWGAGHQSLTVIALINLPDKIRYVVDSAEFKQNKFTPATHIPIVPPERLASDPIEAIIVMTGGYSDEVTKIIRQKFGGKIKIAILRDFGLEKAN